MSDPIDPILLPESTDPPLAITSDTRRRMPEPLPVKLLTVEDARLNYAVGLEKELDQFYKCMLGFERTADQQRIVYRAENFSLHFDVIEPPVQRTDMRTLGIEVLSLRELQQKLTDAEIEFVVQKGLTPGARTFLLRDPAGNWIELAEVARIA